MVNGQPCLERTTTTNSIQLQFEVLKLVASQVEDVDMTLLNNNWCCIVQIDANITLHGYQGGKSLSISAK